MERPGGGWGGNLLDQLLHEQPVTSDRLEIRHHFKGSMTVGTGGGSTEVASPDDQL